MSTQDVISYFNKRMVGLFFFRDVVKEICVYVEDEENYGRDYYRIYFNVEIDDKDIATFSENRIRELNYYFADSASLSGYAFVSYFINDERSPNKSRLETKIKSLKDFYDCYSIVSSLLVHFGNELFGKEFPIRVQNLDNIPEFACMQQILNSEEDYRYYKYQRISFNEIVSQYKQLVLFSKKNEKHYVSNQGNYIEVKQLVAESNYGISVFNVFQYIIMHEISTVIKSSQLLFDAYVDLFQLKHSIDQIQDEDKTTDLLIRADLMQLVNKLCLAKERERKLEKRIFKRLGVDKADIVLLNDGRLVEIRYFKEHAEKFVLFGLLINNDLTLGQRSLEFVAEQVKARLSNDDYVFYKQKYEWKLKERVIRWMTSNNKLLALT